jgi:hypothetical protein
MSRARLLVLRWHALSYSLLRCEGGLGSGVAAFCDLRRDTPLPAPLRAADLARKGAGDKELPS